MLYLCWNKKGRIKGVATSKKHAENMCNEIGDCYIKIEPNVIPNEDIEITQIATHNTRYGFFTYKEAEKVVKEIIELT